MGRGLGEGTTQFIFSLRCRFPFDDGLYFGRLDFPNGESDGPRWQGPHSPIQCQPTHPNLLRRLLLLRNRRHSEFLGQHRPPQLPKNQRRTLRREAAHRPLKVLAQDQSLHHLPPTPKEETLTHRLPQKSVVPSVHPQSLQNYPRPLRHLLLHHLCPLQGQP